MLTALGRRGARAALIAVVLVLGMTTAPLAKVARPGCGACPATCPMHREKRLHCHEGTSSAAPKHHCHSPAATMAASGCHQDADPTTPSLAPAVLPPRTSWHTLPRVGACVPRPGVLDTRATEPPDTPPPIAS